MNEPYVPEVVRHLIDEEGLASSIGVCGRKILIAEPGEVFTRERSEDPRVARLVVLGTETPQASDDLLHVRQLLRTLHLRMRGEDLLDERRARARQADDEYRIGAGVAPAG